MTFIVGVRRGARGGDRGARGGDREAGCNFQFLGLGLEFGRGVIQGDGRLVLRGLGWKVGGGTGDLSTGLVRVFDGGFAGSRLELCLIFENFFLTKSLIPLCLDSRRARVLLMLFNQWGLPLRGGLFRPRDFSISALMCL